MKFNPIKFNFFFLNLKNEQKPQKKLKIENQFHFTLKGNEKLKFALKKKIDI